MTYRIFPRIADSVKSMRGNPHFLGNSPFLCWNPINDAGVSARFPRFFRGDHFHPCIISNTNTAIYCPCLYRPSAYLNVPTAGSGTSECIAAVWIISIFCLFTLFDLLSFELTQREKMQAVEPMTMGSPSSSPSSHNQSAYLPSYLLGHPASQLPSSVRNYCPLTIDLLVI